jgi:hypothetical protein
MVKDLSLSMEVKGCERFKPSHLQFKLVGKEHMTYSKCLT